jgi:hypothetical protein
MEKPMQVVGGRTRSRLTASNLEFTNRCRLFNGERDLSLPILLWKDITALCTGRP